MKQKKIPIRKCIVCGEQSTKKNLIRMVRTEASAVEFDLTGKKNGRGAYICRNKECLDKAIKTRQVERVLKAQLTEDALNKLLEESKKYAE